MTLNDLIDRLEQIRRDCPAAAHAQVRRPIGLTAADVVYDRGEILIGPRPRVMVYSGEQREPWELP